MAFNPRLGVDGSYPKNLCTGLVRLQKKTSVFLLNLLYQMIILLTNDLNFRCMMSMRKNVIGIVSESLLELFESLDP